MVHVWRPDDNFWESAFFLHTGVRTLVQVLYPVRHLAGPTPESLRGI